MTTPAALTTLTDEELAVRLLRSSPVHEHRPAVRLREWARIALAFGDDLSGRADGPPPVVRDRPGGVTDRELTLATYETRGGIVTVYPDALAHSAKVLSAQGIPMTTAQLREVAVAHELAHHLMHGTAGRELSRRLGHTAARPCRGRLRIPGHVAGADEIAAHRFAHRRTGLVHSPLLLTALLFDSYGSDSHGYGGGDPWAS